MIRKAVQQLMLGTVTGTEEKAENTLKAIKSAGYDGIELNGFMIRPSSMMVRLLTRAAGMPTGNGGKLNWQKLVKDCGLSVVSIHEDLGTIERDPDLVLKEAGDFGTDKIVITGMYRFDYTDESEVKKLCERLNRAGENLGKSGIRLLYHNHNIEFCKLKDKRLTPDTAGEPDYLDLTAYGLIMNETDPEYVGFELDSYWIADAGLDPVDVMKRLGNRMELYHINDRGARLSGNSMTPIIKQDSIELGYGNLNLNAFVKQAKEADVDAIVLESHRNFIDNDPVKSLTLSAEYLINAV